MRRKIVATDSFGRLIEEWVDLGPAKAQVGHGAPTAAIAVQVASARNMALSDGRRSPVRKAL